MKHLLLTLRNYPLLSLLVLGPVLAIATPLSLALLSPWLYGYFGFNAEEGIFVKNEARDTFEALYLIANTAVVVFALLALVFAIFQAIGAEQTRRASIYMELTNRYRSDPLRYAIDKMYMIRDAYDSQPAEKKKG